MPWLITCTTPNCNSDSSCTFAQLHHMHLTFAPQITPSNGPMFNPNYLLHPGPIWPTIPNCVHIQSAVFATMHWTDNSQTHTHTDQQTVGGNVHDYRPLSLYRENCDLIIVSYVNYWHRNGYWYNLCHPVPWMHQEMKKSVNDFLQLRKDHFLSFDRQEWWHPVKSRSIVLKFPFWRTWLAQPVWTPQ